jgi:hypothetical protein
VNNILRFTLILLVFQLRSVVGQSVDYGLQSDDTPTLAQRYSTSYATPYYLNTTPRQFNQIYEHTAETGHGNHEGRPGLFQGGSQSLLYMPAFGSGGVSITSYSLSASLGLPCPTRRNPLLISPSFEYTNLAQQTTNGGTDLSNDLYNFRVSFIWMSSLWTNARMLLGVTPSWATDFKQDSDDALQTTAYAMLMWNCNTRTQIVLGVAFLDRSDYSWMPAVGLTWRPGDDCVLEIGVPRTRLSHRISDDYWLTVGGEWGGNSWAVKLPNGSYDKLLYKDLRLVLGIERRRKPQPSAHPAFRYANWSAELGYTFSREITTDRFNIKNSPEDTIFLRMKMTF